MSNAKIPVSHEIYDLAMQWRRRAYCWWNFSRGLTAACLVLAVVSLFSRATIWQPIAFIAALLLADRAVSSWFEAWYTFRVEVFERSEGAALQLIESIKKRSWFLPSHLSHLADFDLEKETQKAFIRILVLGRRHEARGSLYLLLAVAVLTYAIYVMPEKLWLILAVTM